MLTICVRVYSSSIKSICRYVYYTCVPTMELQRLALSQRMLRGLDFCVILARDLRRAVTLRKIISKAKLSFEVSAKGIDLVKSSVLNLHPPDLKLS